MNDLIERYLHEVTRRLPEKDRDEVRRELRTLITDMLPDDPDEDAIKQVLNEMGAPSKLAEKYRTTPRYLISPAIYDDYIHALKWIVPMVAAIVFMVGTVIGIMNGLQETGANGISIFTRTLSGGLSSGITGAFHAVVWVTVGFIIAERTKSKTLPTADAWTVDALPKLPPNNRSRIPLSDSIAELILSAIAGVVALFIWTGVIPIALILEKGNFEITSILSESFMTACIPVTIILLVLQCVECIAKIAVRRKTPLVCSLVVINNFVGIGAILYLFTRGDMFSTEFIEFIQNSSWGDKPFLQFTGNTLMNPAIALLVSSVIALSLWESVKMVYDTWKYSKA